MGKPLRKVTEFVGKFRPDYSEFAADGGAVDVVDLVPEEAWRKRGRWRITVEWEEEK